MDNSDDDDEFGDFGDFDNGTASTVVAPALNTADPLSDVFGTSVV